MLNYVNDNVKLNKKLQKNLINKNEDYLNLYGEYKKLRQMYQKIINIMKNKEFNSDKTLIEYKNKISSLNNKILQLKDSTNEHKLRNVSFTNENKLLKNKNFDLLNKNEELSNKILSVEMN